MCMWWAHFKWDTNLLEYVTHTDFSFHSPLCELSAILFRCLCLCICIWMDGFKWLSFRIMEKLFYCLHDKLKMKIDEFISSNRRIKKRIIIENFRNIFHKVVMFVHTRNVHLYKFFGTNHNNAKSLNCVWLDEKQQHEWLISIHLCGSVAMQRCI